MNTSKITIVTGNAGKVRELKAMADGRLDFEMHNLDLLEIQSLDLSEVIKDKAKRAYEQIRGPIIVDDVSAGLDSLGGLPGTFVKFFNEVLGGDALFKLSKTEKEKATVTCMAVYYDGKDMIVGTGTIRGTVVAPRGNNGFGFDPVIIPDGQSRTMAEMTEQEKMEVSHRGKAFRDLLSKLEKHLDDPQ